ncbi:MAG: hypothetical protein ACT4PE_05640 [Candidatus Eiseniibacteriota bacterium]
MTLVMDEVRARLAAWEPVVKAAVEAVEAWEHQNESDEASMAAGHANNALHDIVSALPPERRP